MIIFAVYIAANLLFLLWIWIKYKMNEVNTVRGFVAHCVRIITNGENFEFREDGEFFETKHGIRTEMLVPYGLFAVNSDAQMYHTANMVFEMAVIDFPHEQGWNISILSSDETHYLNTVKILNEAIS